MLFYVLALAGGGKTNDHFSPDSKVHYFPKAGASFEGFEVGPAAFLPKTDSATLNFQVGKYAQKLTLAVKSGDGGDWEPWTLAACAPRGLTARQAVVAKLMADAKLPASQALVLVGLCAARAAAAVATAAEVAGLSVVDVELAALEAGTTYSFRLRTAAGEHAEGTFHTAPASPQPLSFAVIADS